MSAVGGDIEIGLCEKWRIKAASVSARWCCCVPLPSSVGGRRRKKVKSLNSPLIEVTDLAPADLIDKCDIYLFQRHHGKDAGAPVQVVVSSTAPSAGDDDELVGVTARNLTTDVPEYLRGIIHQLYAETLSGSYIQVQVFHASSSVLVNTYPITVEHGTRIIGGLLVARPLSTAELVDVKQYVVGHTG